MARRPMSLDGPPAELSCKGCSQSIRGYFPETVEAGPKHRCPAERFQPVPFDERTPCTPEKVRAWTGFWRGDR